MLLCFVVGVKSCYWLCLLWALCEYYVYYCCKTLEALSRLKDLLAQSQDFHEQSTIKQLSIDPAMYPFISGWISNHDSWMVIGRIDNVCFNFLLEIKIWKVFKDSPRKIQRPFQRLINLIYFLAILIKRFQ